MNALDKIYTGKAFNYDTYKKGNKVYKLIDIESESYMDKLEELRHIPGIVVPQKLISANKDYYTPYIGYVRKFVSGKDINNYILTHPSDEEIIMLTLNLFDTLDEINKHIILCNIKPSNIVVNKQKPFFINLETFKRVGGIISVDDEKLYLYDSKNHFIDFNILTDKIQLFYVILGLFYGITYINELEYGSLSRLINILKTINADKNLVYYLKSLDNDAINKKSAPSEHFQNILPAIKLPTKDEKAKLARILH